MKVKQITRLIAAFVLLTTVVSAFCFQTVALSKTEASKSNKVALLKNNEHSSNTQSSSANDAIEDEEDEESKIEELHTFTLINNPILLLRAYCKKTASYNSHSVEVSSPPPWGF